MKAKTSGNSRRFERSELRVGMTVRVVKCNCGKTHPGVIEALHSNHIIVRLLDCNQTSDYELDSLRPCVADDLVRAYQALQESGA